MSASWACFPGFLIANAIALSGMTDLLELAPAAQPSTGGRGRSRAGRGRRQAECQRHGDDRHAYETGAVGDVLSGSDTRRSAGCQSLSHGSCGRLLVAI